MSEMEIATLKAKLAIYEQKRLDDARKIAGLNEEITELKAKVFAQYDCYEAKLECEREKIAAIKEKLAATKEKLECVEADRDGCCEEVDKREDVITALHVLWMTIMDKFPGKWDHLQVNIHNKDGTVVLKTVEEVIRKVEKTDALVD